MIIAIDGHSACGKSTLAKDLARKLNFIYIDSGAMYRAATLFFITQGISPTDISQIELNLASLHIRLENHQGLEVFLNEQCVTDLIRSKEINHWVSDYAAIPAIRVKLVELQRSLASLHSVVMDGRDIGSVVFPNAEIKFFVTADIETRTHRRLAELRLKGIEADYHEVQSNLLKRDHLDSTRLDSPLVQCQDAIVIDNSHLTISQQSDLAMQYILPLIEES